MITLNTEEAIKELSRYTKDCYTPKNREAHRMAIEALEGNRKLRAAMAQVQQTDNPLTREIVIRFRQEELLNPEETMHLLVGRLQDMFVLHGKDVQE